MYAIMLFNLNKKSLLKQQGVVNGSGASWTAIFEAFVVPEEAKEHNNAADSFA